MFLNKTLFFYFSRIFLRYFSFTISFFSICIFFTNIFDVLDRLKTNIIKISLILRLVFYKMPYIIIESIPIAIFISVLFLFNSLSKRSELVIIMGNKISIWKILQPILLMSFLIGVFVITIFQPISSFLLNRFQKLDNKIFGSALYSSVSLSETGILVLENNDYEKRILMAKVISENDKILKNISLIILDENGNFTKRIQGEKIEFNNGFMDIHDLILVKDYNDYIKKDFEQIKTNLTFDNLLQRFNFPENISFWDFPNYIEILYKSGINTVTYTRYYYKILFIPLLYIAIVLISSCFTEINSRFNNHNRNFLIGIITSFLTYGFVSLGANILISKEFSPVFSIITPILIIILISSMILLQKFEE